MIFFNRLKSICHIFRDLTGFANSCVMVLIQHGITRYSLELLPTPSYLSELIFFIVITHLHIVMIVIFYNLFFFRHSFYAVLFSINCRITMIATTWFRCSSYWAGKVSIVFQFVWTGKVRTITYTQLRGKDGGWYNIHLSLVSFGVIL